MTDGTIEKGSTPSKKELTVLGAGLVGGAALGALTLALTGDVIAMSIMPGLGLLAALVHISLQRRGVLKNG